MLTTPEVRALISSWAGITDVTRSQLDALVTWSTLDPALRYKITDPIDGGAIVVEPTSTSSIETTAFWLKTNEFRAYGFFRLSWVAWSVDDVSVAWVNQLTASIPFSVNAITTANNVATNINANGWAVVNAVVCPWNTTLQNPYIVLEMKVWGANVDAVTVVTTTMVADDISNMHKWSADTNVVYDIDYVLQSTNALSRITRCYDADLNCEARLALVSAQANNYISWRNSAWVVQPWFFRRGDSYTTGYNLNFRTHSLVWFGSWLEGAIASSNMVLDTVSIGNSLLRWQLINSRWSIILTNVTTWSLFSASNTTRNTTWLWGISNSSLGNSVRTWVTFWTWAFTGTQITNTVWTVSFLNSKFGNNGLNTLLIARSGTFQWMDLWNNASFTVSVPSTLTSVTYNRFKLWNSCTHSGVYTSWTWAVTAEWTEITGISTFSVIATVASDISRTNVNNNSVVTLSWATVNGRTAKVSNGTFTVSTVWVDVDITWYEVNGNYFRKLFTKSWLTGWANNWLAGSPIFVGNLILTSWATSTIRRATGLTGVWALLQLWIETDDDDAMIPATAIAVLNDRLQFTSPANSTATTATRRLIATPTVANITAWSFQWYVEWYIG